MEILGDQIVIAAVGSWLIERLKRCSWFPFVNVQTERLNKLFAALLAALSTAGILVATGWDVSTHTFTVSVANLTLPNIGTFLWGTAGQYVLLKGSYRLFIKNNGAG